MSLHFWGRGEVRLREGPGKQGVFAHRRRRPGWLHPKHGLGAFEADLAALAAFFDRPWTEPTPALSIADQNFVLHEAGCDLRALGRFEEACQPLRRTMESCTEVEDWAHAADAAGALSEALILLGKLEEALDCASRSVELAEKSDNPSARVVMRAVAAHCARQLGRPEGWELFREAERLQKEAQPSRPLLSGVQGFNYCELLLSQGNYREVQERVGQLLQWTDSGWLRALGHLSLGQALLLQTLNEGLADFTTAAAALEEAIGGLRQAGRLDYLPRGLLARARLRQELGDLDWAAADVVEAREIAARASMLLVRADCHMADARLQLARGQLEQARASLGEARLLVNRTAYHRRDAELANLERVVDQVQLLQATDPSVRLAAVRALVELNAREAITVLTARLRDEAEAVRRAADEALLRFTASRCPPAVKALLRERGWVTFADLPAAQPNELALKQV